MHSPSNFPAASGAAENGRRQANASKVEFCSRSFANWFRLFQIAIQIVLSVPFLIYLNMRRARLGKVLMGASL